MAPFFIFPKHFLNMFAGAQQAVFATFIQNSVKSPKTFLNENMFEQ